MTRLEVAAQASGEAPLTLWRLADFAPGEGEAAGAHLAGFDDGSWTPATVPGDVHTALMAAGRLPDPFYDRNESLAAWIEEREWWYRTSFRGGVPPTPPERLRLVFHGLDTFAAVYLNGELLGQTANMFREHAFDVTARVHPGENVLAVRFDPPLSRVDPDALPRWQRPEPRVGMRKAQFGFGWDWGPRLPTVGVWRPVELRRETRARLLGVQFGTQALEEEHRSATVTVSVEAEAFMDAPPLHASVRLVTPTGEILSQTLPLEGGHAGLTFELSPPALWWTHDLGEPALHRLEVDLVCGGEVVDRDRRSVGVRTLTLDTSPDPAERGTRYFRFVLNGVPVFARGANWIPADAFPARVTPERYRSLVELARHANMTMLRVWGGGLYEHETFYDACDELGLLVWQDFMFAGAPYPETPEMAREVEAEATFQVRRLRSHPSLALWCGNNECQWHHDTLHWGEGGAVVPGAAYYHGLLPEIVAREDGLTPYWPGSPFGGNDHNSMEEGNRHNWDVWHGNRPFRRRFGEPMRQDASPDGVDFRHYAADLGRFVSEFGLHAAPGLDTLRRVIPESQLYHHSPSLDHHNKDEPKNKGDRLMANVTGVPGNLAELVRFSQVAQAEGLKFAVEHYRRRRPHCSGALVWQLNDCWPCLSWSVVDYFGVPKAAYWALRRAFAPVLTSFQETPDGVELWVTNDTRRPVRDAATVTLRCFDGRELDTFGAEIDVPPLSSLCVAAWSHAVLRPGPDRYLAVRSRSEAFWPNRHFFVPVKDLARERGQVEASLTPGPNGPLVTVRAQRYARLVHLDLEGVDGADLSDNDFDLEPGEARTVVVSSAVGDPTGLRVTWQ